jgi:PKD repeat protein
VQFTDKSSGSPTSWAWTFGDGGTSTTQSPLHTYTANGTYTVTLTASNAYGDSTKTKANLIVISGSPPPPPPPPPEVDFVGSPRSGAVPFDVVFNDLSTNTPTSWLWTLSDGQTSTVQNPTFTLTERADIDVTLKATNAGGDGELTKPAYITANRLSISGTQLIGEDGNPVVPRGLTDGHFELTHAGDEAADAALGANTLVTVVRIYGTYGTGYQQDMQEEGQPGDLDPVYLADIVTRLTASRAAGMYNFVRMDSDKGQGSEASGGNDYFSGSSEGNRKWGIHIGTAVYLAQHYGDLIDAMEPIVEPNSAVVATKEILWAKQEEFMTAVLAVAPHMLFPIGPRDYSAGNIANAINPDWTDVASPFYRHVFMTCNFLDNLSMDAAQRVSRMNLLDSTRTAMGVPAWIDQIATHNSNDPTDANLDACMSLADNATGGPIGYAQWERVSMADTADGNYYLTNQADPNSARGAHTARIAMVSRHFTGTAGVTNTWLSRRLLATNMGPGYDFATRVYVNLLHQMRAFGTLADSYVSVPLKSDGYPQAGQTCVCYFLTRMDASEAGDYLIEVLGDETDMQNAGDGTLHSVSFDGTKTTGTITISGAAASLGIRFNSVGAGFGGLKVHPPGYPLNTTKVYRDEALHHFGMFRQVRFMDWQETNGPETGGGGNQDTDWATSRAANYASASGYKHSLKACFDFCAAIDADPYTNVPAKFTDAAIFSYVEAGLSYLPAGRSWYIECPANEPWNGDFQQYHDLRAAAYAAGSVVAGVDITSLSRTSNVVTAGVGSGHGVAVGDQVYVRQKNGLFAAGLQTVTAITSTTISWASSGSNGAIAHADDDTSIYLDPSNALVAPVTTYYTADQWPIALQVKGRYEVSRARRVWLSADSLGQADRVRVIYGVWMDNYFNSVDSIAWAAEQYGDVSWLYAMTPALYLRPANPGACTTVDEVFNQLEDAKTAILPRALLWGNLMRSWGMHLVAYEGLEHTHDFGGHTAIFVSAHQDDRMRVLNKDLLQGWLDRGGEGMYAFFSGWRREMLSGTDSWVDVVGDFSTGDTQPKHQAWVELKDEDATAQPLSGLTSGTILYTDVIASGYQGVANGQLVIRPTHKIKPTCIVVSVPSDGSYTIAIDAGTDTATVTATLLIDGVAHDVGNLPTVASVFSGAHPGEALSATLTLTAGDHNVAVELPAPTRAGWVALCRVRVS